ncbi:hypothetical protein ACIQYW_18605 [Rhodococcus erythropolis]|uniref:hypothetical protein n=1 Tax=Rhodococcus TaxID=1827 RepID=UPI001A187486|nr:hypothetical protein [Rhodococcus sp. (in: high G+C Gram-positive bacteria)]EGS4806819.1 hypothetical protein [Listeria monocytogenes]MBJ7476805.1 hypothetical protein [Rhodococcus sp. (in: high G+C Gram-positive bacteria)]
MMMLADGDVKLIHTVEPDGRVRITIEIAGEVVRAPTFAHTTYSLESLTFMDEIASQDFRRSIR